MFLERCVCGERPEIEKQGACDAVYKVRCPNCGMTSPNLARSEEDAAEEWNVHILNVINAISRGRLF